ncbi:hypothetical protein A3860_17745 [Niastella vici]|uniref:Uncharacterized protein n=1 Tax=Niastella vici TaxID=1703345 RepID=A0A1V9G4S8_9BACT|nr:hypothetical protein [Niastella vici]OQP65508.1 hypothetical protein A3860_17745 [Niastella vici]
MKPLIVLTLVLSIPLFSFAQRMYRYGCLVNRFGDTLYGQISFDHWKDPERVFFKEHNASTIRYSLYEVRAIMFPGSDCYKRIIDQEGPKILHILIDGNRIQLYEQLGGYRQFYIGFGSRYDPVVVTQAAFRPLPRYFNTKEFEYKFQYLDPRTESNIVTDTLQLKSTFFSKSFLIDFAHALNGNAGFKPLTQFHPRTHFVPFISAGHAMMVASGSLNKTWLSPLKFKKESITYVEGGIDIYNNWFFKGFRLRLSAGYLPPVTVSGQSQSDSTRWTLFYNSRQSIITVGTSLIYGHNLGKVCPYAYFGISYKLQILGHNHPELYTKFENSVANFSNELKYYRAGMTPGLKAGMLFTRAARIELNGFYDWAFLLAYSKKNGYGIFKNTAGLGLAYHFSRQPEQQ